MVLKILYKIIIIACELTRSCQIINSETVTGIFREIMKSRYRRLFLENNAATELSLLQNLSIIWFVDERVSNRGNPDSEHNR